MGHKTQSARLGNARGALVDRRQANWRDYTKPLEAEITRSVESTELIDSARNTLANGNRNRLARSGRDMGRYGASLDAHARNELQHQGGQRDALQSTLTLNNARFAQHERNEDTAAFAMNIGRGVVAQSDAAFNSAYGNITAADNAKTQADAQRSAQRSQTVGSLAGMGIGAYMAYGTAMGGPMGAAVGAGVGLLLSAFG